MNTTAPGLRTTVPGVWGVGDANSDNSTNVPHATSSGKKAAVFCHGGLGFYQAMYRVANWMQWNWRQRSWHRSAAARPKEQPCWMTNLCTSGPRDRWAMRSRTFIRDLPASESSGYARFFACLHSPTLFAIECTPPFGIFQNTNKNRPVGLGSRGWSMDKYLAR